MMVLDYKDVTFSLRDRRARQRRRRLCWFLLAVLAAAAFLCFRCWRTRSAVSGIQDLLLAGRLEEAGRRLQALGSPLFQRDAIRELRAVSELFGGRLDAASVHLAGLRRGRATAALRAGPLLRHFFDSGQYAPLKIYADHLLPGGSDEARWACALYRAAFLDAEGSDQAAASLGAPFRRSNAKALDILARFNRSLREGRVDYVFDRRGVPVAWFDVRRRVTRALVPGMDFAAFDAEFRKGARRFRLTLDGELQRKIDRLFQGYFGTLVLLDLPENGIAAAYSKPRSGAANAAFHERFEPGSVVKPVTLLAYLRAGAPGLFPLECTGALTVGRRAFYDWARHGTVRDPVQALAVSCNVAFARMGRAAGRDALVDLLRRFFFDAPAFADRPGEFATGSVRDVGGDERRLADLSVGLGEVTLTTVHAAVLAALFAQNGQHFPPYLVDDTKNILDLGFYRHEARPQRRLADDLNFLRVRKAMAAAVEDENGTARRARSADVRLAAKTGAGGDPARGLDAILIGFFPCDEPRYAFAFRLEGAGRADVVGALFLRDLIRVLYAK